MIAEARLAHIETLVREAQQEPPLIGTHFDGCWACHPGCAVALVDELTKELRAAVQRQVTLDRIILAALYKEKPPPDPEVAAELERISAAWRAYPRS